MAQKLTPGIREPKELVVSEIKLMKKHLEEELLQTIGRFELATGLGVIQVVIDVHDASSWGEAQTAENLSVVLDI